MKTAFVGLHRTAKHGSHTQLVIEPVSSRATLPYLCWESLVSNLPPLFCYGGPACARRTRSTRPRQPHPRRLDDLHGWFETATFEAR